MGSPLIQRKHKGCANTDVELVYQARLIGSAKRQRDADTNECDRQAATTNADHSGCDMSTGFDHPRIEVCQIVLGMTFMQ